MERNIAVLSGDGIGPEVMDQAIQVLDTIADVFNHRFHYHFAKIGGAAFAQYHDHCPFETLAICKTADAILFGSVGGPVALQNEPQWKNCETNSILKIRQFFNFNINIRPIQVSPSLHALSPLKRSRGVDFLIFRELNGDVYFGDHVLENRRDGQVAIDTGIYTELQIQRIAHAAFKAARQRKKKIVSVDKANVLAMSKLWRAVFTEIHRQYTDVELHHMLVDNAAMQLILNPQQFDVIVTANLFGDILSDLAAALPGSIGLIPSISMNEHGFGLYEPSGGSAPELTNQNCANPIAQIRSAGLMLYHSFGLEKEYCLIEKALEMVLEQHIMTKDMDPNQHVSTTEFTRRLIKIMCTLT